MPRYEIILSVTQEVSAKDSQEAGQLAIEGVYLAHPDRLVKPPKILDIITLPDEPVPEPELTTTEFIPERLRFGLSTLAGGKSSTGQLLSRFEARMAYGDDELLGPEGKWEVIGYTVQGKPQTPAWIRQSVRILNSLNLPAYCASLVPDLFAWLQARSKQKLFWNISEEEQLRIIKLEFSLE